MPLFTDEQLQLIRQIVRRRHTAIIASVFGPEALSPDEIAQLEAAGMLRPELTVIDDAYRLGHAIGIIDAPKAASMSLDAFEDYLREDPIQLTDSEQRAVASARRMAADNVRNLSTKIERETGRLLDEAEQRDAIRERTVTAIERRKTVGRLKTELGKITKDYDRDWSRVAITELHNARQRGQADRFRDRYGSDSWAFKRAMPDACPHCKRLHNGPDGMPRIFRLSELEANGTNVGRKAADWLPVVGTVHPYCQCELVHIPDGWGFNADGEMVPGGEMGVRYDGGELERSIRAERDLRKAHQIRGRIEIAGLTIAIENPVGSIRCWRTPEGLEGETRMRCAYGYIEGTRGAHAEGLDAYDAFVGPDPASPWAFIVHQQAPPDFDRWDEDKAMLGFRTAEQAKEAYLAHYDDARFFGSLSMLPIEEFRLKVLRTSLPGEDGMVKADPVFGAFVIRPEIELPEWLGLLIWARDIGKAAGHKYIRRVPTGKERPKYRYFYAVTGGRGLGHESEIQVGAAFKVPHAGKEGHFHVTAINGDKVTIRHDESGHEEPITKEALQQLLHQQHAEAIEQKRQKLGREREAVAQHGSEKQKRRIEEEHKRFTAQFGTGEKEKPKLAAEKPAEPHQERLKLGDIGGLEGATKIQTFRTKAEAKAAAQSIGWPTTHARTWNLGGQKLPGGQKLGKWILMEGDHQIVTREAFQALQDRPEKEHQKPEKLQIPKEEPEPKSPDALPAKRHGGLGKVVDMLVEAGGIDLGGVDVHTDEFYEHFSDGHEGVVPDAKVRRIIGSGADPAKIARDLMVQTLREVKAREWRDVSEARSIKGQSPLDYFTNLEQLDQLRLPDRIVERHDIEDQYAHYEDLRADQDEDGDGKLDDRELTAEEEQQLTEEAFDFDPAMFRSMTWASRLRPVHGSKRRVWRDREGELWFEHTPDRAQDLQKAEVELVSVPRRREGVWETRYFEKASGTLHSMFATFASPAGNRAVHEGGRGFTIRLQRLDANQQAAENRKPPHRAGFDPLKGYRAEYHQQHHFQWLPEERRKKLRSVRSDDVGRLHPLNEDEIVARYNELTEETMAQIPQNRERLGRKTREREEAFELENRHPDGIRKGEVTVQKRGLGLVRLRYGDDFEVEARGEQRMFPTLSSACDHVWCLQKGYADAADYKAQTGRNKVPSGAGWKFWGLSG